MVTITALDPNTQIHKVTLNQTALSQTVQANPSQTLVGAFKGIQGKRVEWKAESRSELYAAAREAKEECDRESASAFGSRSCFKVIAGAALMGVAAACTVVFALYSSATK